MSTLEWGNAVVANKISVAVLEQLHRDAANSLPSGHRYEIRARSEFGGLAGLAWYAHTLMAKDVRWGGAHGLKDGFYLIGQYVTEGA